jgi:SAM-dependent methyltransferase
MGLSMLFEIKELLDRLALPFYKMSGHRPWSPGYYTVKNGTIGSAIDMGLLSDVAELPAKYGYRVDERVVEYPWLFAQLAENPGRMLDAGSALNHRFLLDRAPLKNAQLTIMTLAPEKRCFWDRSISYVFGDLRKTLFADSVFDVVASISTIEHIGLDNTMLYTGDASKKESDALGFTPAVAEFRRVLKPGGVCLITVPFGRRGVHGWYQVFDLDLVARVIQAFQPSDHTVEYFGYGMDGWRRVEPAEIADAEFFDVHEGRAFDGDFAAGARGVACIRLVA